MDHDKILSSEVIQMLVSSVAQRDHAPLTESEAERLLDAMTRAQSGVPTGFQNTGRKD